jgi:3',5'-cyclic AMP phosphodiesterase CpdA
LSLPRPGARALAVLLTAALIPAARLQAKDEGCEITGVPRVVAVGDVHGAYPELVAVLRLAGIVDEKQRWIAGKTHLVQTGDILDRGSETRPVMELLMRLEGEARKAGGRVHALLGNHEVMNVIGDLRYVSREEYKAFETPRSRETWDAFYRSRAEAARQQAKDAKQGFDEAAFRARFEEQAPLGFVERIQAFSEDGRYGKWLRERRGVLRIDGTVFLHGGLTPETAALGCEAINATVRREITSEIAKTREQPLASLSASENGPFWYRGMAREDETAWLPSLERVLQSIGAHTVVIGHTVTGDGRIKPRFGGRVLMIDAGMNPLYGRNLAALEIAPGPRFTALYESRREELARPAAAALAPPVPKAQAARRARPAAGRSVASGTGH